jgi:lysophospholipase L1-like esterase
MDQGNLDGLKPKAVVIMIGTNNTGHRMGPADATASGVKAIVEGVQKKCPDAKILLLAIFPRGETATDKRRVRNEEINALISKLADDKKVFFKNINDKFLEKDGTLSKKIMPDLLHLSPEGYAIWASAIKADLEKLIK